MSQPTDTHSSGEMLASAGDDGTIILWVPAENQSLHATFGEEGLEDKETWRVKTMCRSSGSEIYDLAWSPDGMFFITGSMDNITRIYNAHTGMAEATRMAKTLALTDISRRTRPPSRRPQPLRTRSRLGPAQRIHSHAVVGSLSSCIHTQDQGWHSAPHKAQPRRKDGDAHTQGVEPQPCSARLPRTSFVCW